MFCSKDIEKLKVIISEVELKCDYYERIYIEPKSIDTVVTKIELYLEGRGYILGGSGKKGG